MKKCFLAIFAVFFSLSLLLQSAPAEAKGKKASRHKKINDSILLEEVTGYYSKGKLKNAATLPDVSENFYRLFPKRPRAFGASVTIAMINNTATEIQQLFPAGERLQIGDISAKAGGPISRHNSHQNGLDADISYLRFDNNEQEVGKDGFEENFVHGGILSPNFDLERNWALFKLMVKKSNVGRIFVAPEIKHELCNLAQNLSELDSEAETLRRLRPYQDHSDHMHVRMDCPKGHARCTPQPAPPEGTGCQLMLEHDV